MLANGDVTPMDVSTPLNAAEMLGKPVEMNGGLDDENQG